MKYSRQGLELTEHFEGCRLVAYQDVAGVWTIGYGHTQGVYPGMTISQELAEQQLAFDVEHAESAVDQYVHVPLTQGQFDGLVDFVFNVGVGNFLRSTLLQILNTGNFPGAQAEFARWDHAGGRELSGLKVRRTAESKEFLES